MGIKVLEKLWIVPYLNGSSHVKNGVIFIVHDKLDKNWGKIEV